MQALRERAFSARFSFAGHPLHLFGSGRKRQLLDIRGAMGAPPFGSINALHGDAIRLLWLCLHDGKTLEAMQAGIGLPGNVRMPITARFQNAMDRWADANDELLREPGTPDDEGDSSPLIIELFLEIWQQSEAPRAISASPDLEAETSGN